MASIKNTGVAGRNKYQQQQQQQAGGAGTDQLPPPVMPPLTNVAQKNQRTQVSRYQAQQPPVQQAAPRLRDYQTTSTAIDPRKIFTRNQLGVTDQAFATVDQVNKGEANWVDVYTEERKKILSDPDFYKQNQITKYSPAIQQQILADPNFDWKQLPKWQQAFYSASSNPAAMGAVQGLVMGAGNPGGALVGGALGWASSVLGYDPNKEFWEQGDGKLTADFAQVQDAARGAFGLLNWGAEQVEKGIGTAAQVANYAADPNKQVVDLFKNFENTWNSSTNFFEVITPAINESFSAENKAKEGALNPIYQQILPIYITAKIGEIILNPEKYKGSEIYLGTSSPIPLDESWITRIEEARKEVEQGRPYREVMMDIQNGVLAQIGDMAGQGIADPLNFVGKAEAKAGEVTARITGDKIAEAAFSQAEGISDARQRIQNIVNNPAEALKIDPNYKIDELGTMTKMMAGLTKDNKVKGGLLPSAGALLDYNPPKKSITGFIDSLTSLTPEARARTGQDLLVRNLGSIMASYFNGNDVSGFGNWWKSFTKGDMTQSAELSRTMANSPEFYTVLPAAKGFDIDGQLAVWETSEPARMTVSSVADVLGVNPMTFIEDVVKRGMGADDFARLTDKLKTADTPAAKALLKDIELGRFTEASLTEAVTTFSDGKIPFHPGQWMAETLDAIKGHYDQWAVDHFKLEEESRKTLFRVTAVMKSAQSILLLGANPGYMISNVLPTMVTRAAHGVYGYMTPTALDNFFGRMGFSLEDGFAPNRLTEGVGPGGLIDQTRQTGDAIREATLGKGKLTDIQRALGKVGSAMPFNKLSRLLEGYEGKMAYAIGIKKMWGESWRRGTGFREIPPALLTELTRTVGKSAADILYSQIEAGMTKQEVFNIVTGRSADVKSRSLINQVAKDMDTPASKAASMLEQLGVLDDLDANLKGADTSLRIDKAFEKARRTAQIEIDQQASRDAVARIEHISNRIQTEGPKAITDITIDMESQGNELWLKHLERMGDLAEVIDSIDNPDTRRRMYAIKYAESAAEHRRFNAQRSSTYLGILKAIGLESGEAGRGLLSTLADLDRVNDNAYRTTRDLRDQHFKKWNNDDWSNPRRQVEYDSVEKQVDKVWKEATKAEAANLKKFGEFMATQYEQLFSVEAGEAARQAWEQITAFRGEMTKRRDDFRATQKQAQAAGVPRAQRQAVAKEFWGKTYSYMIMEMQRVKEEAIARLDRIALNGKGGTPTGAGIDPTRPGGGGGYINPEMEALRQQAQERARIQKEKLDAVWEVASQYSKKLPNNSSNFDKGYLQDGSHLLNTLKKEEYGGDPTITSLKDAAEKLTPEQIKNIFDAREGNKAETQAAFEAEQVRRFQEETANAELRAKNKKVAENVQVLQNIRKRGGIDIESWKQVADKPEGYQVGVFSRTGKNRWAADQMARLLADDGYPIDVNDPADVGGVRQMIDLIQRARAGEEIYPIGHEFIVDAEVAKAQADFIERQIAEANDFDAARWENDMADAIEAMDMNKATDLWEQLPEDIQDTARVNGETFTEYYIRAGEEISTRAQSEAETISIAENQVRAEAAVKQQETTATTAMTRQLFREKLQDSFGLNEDMTDTVMSLTDARAESWAAIEGGTADDWYATRIADVVKDGDNVDLAQEAYHGSPHRFDQFTLDHMGSGEGAQAYGWGLYFAGDQAVAEYYRKGIAGNREISKINTELSRVSREMDKARNHPTKVMGEFKLEKLQQEYESLLSQREAIRKDEIKVGQTYKVEIPDDGYLLWDKPLSEQPESVRQAVLSSELGKYRYDTPIWKLSGEELYTRAEAEIGKKAASIALKEAGINGIQYLDGSSRGKGEGNYNYVIFDDAAIQIKETYYQTQGKDITYSVERTGYPDGSYHVRGSDGNLYNIKGGKIEPKADGALPRRFKSFEDATAALAKAGYETGADGTPTPRTAKGGVQFLDDGKAIIRAFEKADVYTAVHEISHVFFKDLPEADYNTITGWANLTKKINTDTWRSEAGNFTIRETGTDFIYKDISGAERKFKTLEQAKSVLYQEAFARGFEKYLADGSAPTPKLKAIFQKFKEWAGRIYGAIIGSPIDVNLNSKVKDVFDSLLVGEKKAVDVGDILMQLGYDSKTHRIDPTTGQVRRVDELNIRVNEAQSKSQAEALVSTDFQSKLDAMKKGQPVRVGKADPATATTTPPAKGTDVWKMSYPEYEASLLREQKEYATRRIEQVQKRDFADYAEELSIDSTKEIAKMEAMQKRETVSYELYGDARESYRKAIEKALIDEQAVPDEIKQAYYVMGKEGNLSGAEYKNLQQAGRGPADTLFQMDDPKNNVLSDIERRIANSEAMNKRVPGLADEKYTAKLQAAKDTYQEYVKKYGEEYPIVLIKDQPETKGRPWYGAVIAPSSKGVGMWQATYFDERGFSGDFQSNTRGEAYWDIFSQGLTRPDPDLLDTVSDTDLFNAGVKWSQLPPEEKFKTSINEVMQQMKDNPNALFQEADPRMPLGGYEEAADWLPQSEVMDEGWSSEVQPLLDKMQEAATRQLSEPKLDGAYKDMTPEGQKMLQQYLNGVTQDMASTKMAAQRWGAEKRDNAMLNYNRRYGFDKMLDVVFPYQFFYTRSMMQWAARALDKPAWLSNYARLRKQQDRYENNLPERLRGKMRIDAPWLPDWMGDGLYVDPLATLFTPHNFLRPFEQMTKDKNMQVIEAERILQEWAADGTVPEGQIQEAAQTRGGSTWERALAEAKLRREAEISNPMDFVSTMFGPAWYLTTPAKLLNIGKDGPETLTELPLTRTARAVDTVTQGTWAEPIGNVLGLLAKPEEAFREANNLPQFGEYGDYYTDRNIANMVAEGLITPEEAQIAMIERQGDIFTAAQERTKMELAMRVPTAGFIYAALNEGVAAAAQASVPSLFGAGILPTGELEYRGMKDEWNEAWKLRDAGDTEAINRFFEKNPEYEAYLAKGKEPEERLRSFLIGQIWDGYMELGDTNRKQATAEMGDLFKQAFLNSETRSYDTLDIEQLTQWAQMVNQRVPNVQQTAPAIANPRQVNYYAPEVTQITDAFYQQRKRLYGDYYELEQGYYDLPRSERTSYLIANPQLKEYWNWKDGYYQRYPELVPVFKGQVFKRIDTSNWPLGLTDYVEAYAFAGEKLPNGAYKALEQVWINEGRPMDDFDTWVKSQVLPAIQYQSGAQMQP